MVTTHVGKLLGACRCLYSFSSVAVVNTNKKNTKIKAQQNTLRLKGLFGLQFERINIHHDGEVTDGKKKGRQGMEIG